MGIVKGSGPEDDQLPAWMAQAPQKVDLSKKADDGDAHGGVGEGQAPYPAHFQAIIEAVTMGKPVPGVREIPNTVVRQAVCATLSFLAFVSRPPSSLSFCCSHTHASISPGYSPGRQVAASAQAVGETPVPDNWCERNWI
jgi:hypothetical protein